MRKITDGDPREENIRIWIDRKGPGGWYRFACYDFTTPEKIKATIEYLNSHCDRPILLEYLAFLQGAILTLGRSS